MKIAFDATAIYGSKNRGVGKYTISEFNEIIKDYPQDEFYYFNVYGESHIGRYLTKSKNLHEIMYYTGKNHIFASDESYADYFGCLLQSFLSQYQIDVFYVTSLVDVNAVDYQRSWFGEVPVVCTFYDLIPYIFKENYLPSEQKINWYNNKIGQLRWMEQGYAISQSAGDDLCRYKNFSPQKVTVIYGAQDERFKKIAYQDDEKKTVFEKYGIKDAYILCTGGDDARKNIAGLIEAFSALPAEQSQKTQLVVACKLSEQSKDNYQKIAENHGIGDRVIFTGFVSDEEQLLLYNCAELQAFISKYEGLGLPVLEGYACGIPVVTAANSSLIEVAGKAAILADLSEPKSVTESLLHALTMSENEKEARQEQANILLNTTFNIKNTAKRVMESLHRLPLRNAAKAKEIKKVAYFTPLPPVRSGISDFSVDVLNSLACELDTIDVFIDNGYRPSCSLPENVRVCNYREYDPKNYDETIYQFGNSPFHLYMLDNIKNAPGIVELHDANVFGLANFAFHTDENMWQQIIREDYPDGILKEDYLSGYVVNYAKKIIVHSEDAGRTLLNRNFGRDIYVIPHYAKKEPEGKHEFSEERKRWGNNADEIKIGVFGIVARTKRIVPILNAARMLKENDYRFSLRFVGECIQPDLKEEFEAFISENGLEDTISATGFVSLEDMNAYMDQTEICLNLRYPYNGETSGTMSRMLAKGKCIVVNNIGSFSEIPDGAAIKLPSVSEMEEDEEVELIYFALKRLIDKPTLIRKIGGNAKKYAEAKLDLPIIVQQYKEVMQAPLKQRIKEETIQRMCRDELCKLDYSRYEVDHLLKQILE